jgi:hypothetical protein
MILSVVSFSRIVALLVLCGTLAFAQNGTIQGTIADPSGAAVAGAAVRVVDESRGLVVRETLSEPTGIFRLVQLLRGTYTLKVEVRGFKSVERKGLVLDPNQIMDLGFINLEIGQTAETVTVEAEVPLIETSTSNKSFTITSRQVTELSLNGRDFQSLMLTLPGVVTNNTSNFRLAFNNTDQFNVNGLRGSMNNFFLDGAINTDVGANDGQYTQLSMDAVGEFRVQNSVFAAEHGRNPGVLLSASTKSGGQKFHGTLYHFLRNDAFDARLPFDTTGKPPILRFNQFGGNISGPVVLPKWSTKANKTMFFFFNYEGTRASRPTGGNFIDYVHPDLLNGDLSRLYRGVKSAFHPYDVGQVFRPGSVVRDSAGRIINGDPYPNNVIPRSEWSANAPAFLNVIGGFSTAGGVSLAPTNPELLRVPFQDYYRFNKNQYVARYDWNVSSNTNFFFRWVWDPQREEQQRGIFSTLPYPIYPMFREKPGQSFSWNLINVINPTTTNEFIFALNDLNQQVNVLPGTPQSQYDRTALGFKFPELYSGVNLNNRFPRFNCGVGACNFTNFSSGWLSEATTFAVTNNFTKIKGSHSFKFGFFWNQNNNGQQPTWVDQIQFDFGSNAINSRDSGTTFANMLLGNYTSITQSDGRYYANFRFRGFEWYAQDSWKVSKKLTLEYGLRHVFYGPTYTRGDILMWYFDPALYNPAQSVTIDTVSPAPLRGRIVPNSGNRFNGMVQEGSPGVAKGFTEPRWNQISPRIGIAWDPFGDGKTSVRAGGGIFWERIRQNNLNFDGVRNPPTETQPIIYSGRVDEITPALVTSGVLFPPSAAVSAWARNGKTPTIYSWSFGIQRQLPGNTSVEVSYVGNVTNHLMDARDINQLPLGTTIFTNALQQANNVQDAIRPYRGYRSINFTDFGANSNYNSLQVRATRRFSKNLTFNGSYAWSKAMGQTETDGENIGYYLDRRRNYGPLDYDRLHVLTLDYVYTLPEFSKNMGNNLFARAVLDGWQLSGITRFSTGTPLTVTSNGNPGTLGGGVRADYLGGNPYPETKDRFNYFNVFAFGRPLDGALGNTANGILRGPGIHNWDASMFKNFFFTEQVRLQLRFEFFNIFNHTQWAGVNMGISVPNPGQAITQATRARSGEVTSTRDPRQLQMGVKLYF